MRIAISVITILILSLSIGCSNSNNGITPPGTENLTATTDDSGWQLLDSGIMNLDDGSIEQNNRAAEAYMNITSFLGSNFSYTIDGIIPPDIYNINLKINNTTLWTVHDVVIVFDDLYGKTVMNPDSYMDIYEPYDIDPFIAFRYNAPARAFPPGIDQQQLLLKYPGGSAMVKYFILAHLGGNTGGVYELKDMAVGGYLLPTGGNATLMVRVLDHQNNVSRVIADTTVFTGGYSFMTESAIPGIWEVDISNTQGAPLGDYRILLMANSPASPAYNTYNYMNVSVVESAAWPIFEDFESPKPEWIAHGGEWWGIANGYLDASAGLDGGGTCFEMERTDPDPAEENTNISYVSSPPIEVPSSTQDLVLTFNHKIQVDVPEIFGHFAWDMCYVRIDGVQVFPTGGPPYEDNYYPWTFDPMKCWTSEYPMTESVFNLGKVYNGTTIQVEFVLDTYDYIDNCDPPWFGWLIEDFRMEHLGG
ncbi:MAG: hypothetical protein ABIG42_05615 [bacterium]